MSRMHGLRALCTAEFKAAQLCLGLTVAMQLAAAGVGVVTATVPGFAGWGAMALVALASVVAGLRSRGEKHAARGNDMLRQLDLEDGLGRPVSPEVVADLRVSAAWYVDRASKRAVPTRYFESTNKASARRLVENVRESAWWTKHLAGDMSRIARWFSASLFVVVVLILIAVTQSVITPGDTWPAWIAALTLFLIGQGPWQVATRYADYSTRAERIQKEAGRLLREGAVTELEAMDLVAEYHLIRQASPIIPTAWHQLRQRALNQEWNEVATRLAGTPVLEGPGATRIDPG